MERKPVRIFLDSNVVLSGLLSSTGAPRIILDILSLSLPGIIGLTGRYNLIEIERNIKKKAPAVLPVYNEYLPKLHLEIVPLPSAAEAAMRSGIIADKDTPVLVSAINGRADFLITGDKKHFDKAKIRKTIPCRILNPSEFLEELAVILTNTD
jgi:predicted nucleic acid-binding protein